MSNVNCIKILNSILDEVNDKCCSGYEGNKKGDCAGCPYINTEECVRYLFDQDPVKYFKLIITKNLLSIMSKESIDIDLIPKAKANEIVFNTIKEFYDIKEDDIDVPISDKDKLLMEINKTICFKINNFKE